MELIRVEIDYLTSNSTFSLEGMFEVTFLAILLVYFKTFANWL